MNVLAPQCAAEPVLSARVAGEASCQLGLDDVDATELPKCVRISLGCSPPEMNPKSQGHVDGQWDGLPQMQDYGVRGVGPGLQDLLGVEPERDGAAPIVLESAGLCLEQDSSVRRGPTAK